jgi:hypothetical protein
MYCSSKPHYRAGRHAYPTQLVLQHAADIRHVLSREGENLFGVTALWRTIVEVNMKRRHNICSPPFYSSLYTSSFLAFHLLLRFVSLLLLIRPVSLQLFSCLFCFSLVIVLCLISCLFLFSYSFLPCSSFFMFPNLPTFVIFLPLLILFLGSSSSKPWPAHYKLMVLTLNC